MRMSTNGGSSYDSTGVYAYDRMVWRNTATPLVDGATAATEIKLHSITTGGQVTGTGLSLSGYIKLYNPAGSQYKQILAEFNGNDGNRLRSHTFGQYESATAVNAFQFFFSSGNIASGTIRVYGLSKTANLGVATIATGALSSRPTASVPGRVYLPNDGVTFARDNGTSWDSFGPVYPLTAPPTGVWSWRNQGSSTIAETLDSLQLVAAGTGSPTNLVARVKAAPATPYTITAHILPIPIQKTFLGYGVCFRQNGAGTGTGRLVVMYWDAANVAGTASPTLRIEKWTSETTFSGSYVEYLATQAPRWFRITDDGVNLIFYVSADGQNFIQVHSVARLDFLLQGADQVGFFAFTSNQAVPNINVPVTVLSWKEQ